MLQEVNILSTLLTITPFLGELAAHIVTCPSIPNWYEVMHRCVKGIIKLMLHI